MNLTFQCLKKYFPELNEKVIGRERIVEVLSDLNISVFEVPMRGRGAYVLDAADGAQYVFIKYNLQSLIRHETLCFESVHALAHVPAEFLARRHNLQSEVFSLVMMMPETMLATLERIKDQLDDEAYGFLMRRLEVKAVWKI